MFIKTDFYESEILRADDVLDMFFVLSIMMGNTT